METQLHAIRNAANLSSTGYYGGITGYPEAERSYCDTEQRMLNVYITFYKSPGGAWVTEAEQSEE